MVDINAAADSVAAVAAHPVTVQVINQGPGIWGNVATGSITAGAAIAAVMLTHRFTLKREKAVAKDKQIRERYFIGTELVFMLERFSQRCAPAAYESGYYDHESGYIQVTHDLPDIDYSSITGDWRSLPQELMYRLIQIPVLQEEARKSVAAAFNNDSPWDGDDGLYEFNKQSCRLGLRAIRLSRELRRLCSMPEDELSVHPWSAWRTLSSVRARIIDTDLRHARGHHKMMSELSIPVAVSSSQTSDHKEGDRT